MPSPLHLDPLIDVIDQSTLTPEKIDTLAFIQQRKDDIDSRQRARAATRLASVDFVLGRLVEWRTGSTVPRPFDTPPFRRTPRAHH